MTYYYLTRLVYAAASLEHNNSVARVASIYMDALLEQVWQCIQHTAADLQPLILLRRHCLPVCRADDWLLGFTKTCRASLIGFCKPYYGLVEPTPTPVSCL